MVAASSAVESDAETETLPVPTDQQAKRAAEMEEGAEGVEVEEPASPT